MYIIDEVGTGSYQKRYITSEAWQAMFAPCGSYPYTNVSSGYLSSYPWGSTVWGSSPRPDGQLISVSGTVYMIEGGKKRWIINPPALQSYNFVQPICDVSASEASAYGTGANMKAREGTLINGSGPEVYVIMESASGAYYKRHILSRDSFDYYGLDWSAIREWNQTYVNQYSTVSHAHPYKSTFTGDWYKSLVSNDLTFHRSDEGGGLANWNTAITGAVNGWNNASNPTDFVEQGISASNDVYVNVGNYSFSVGGRVRFCTSQQGPCENSTGTGTWYHAKVELNNLRTSATFRQGLTAHELGHVLGLAHDGLDSNTRDYECGPPRVPETVMDYDCYLQNPYLTGPAAWDSCGLNHRYPTSTWGWSGC